MVSTGCSYDPRVRVALDALNQDRISCVLLRFTEKDDDLASIKDLNATGILKVWKIYRKSTRKDAIVDVPVDDFFVQPEKNDDEDEEKTTGKQFEGWTFDAKKYKKTHKRDFYTDKKKGAKEFRTIWNHFSAQLKDHGHPESEVELGIINKKQQPPQPLFGVVKYRYWKTAGTDFDCPLIVFYGDDDYTFAKKRVDAETGKKVKDDGFNRRFVSTGSGGMVKGLYGGSVLKNVTSHTLLDGKEAHAAFLDACLTKKSPVEYQHIVQVEEEQSGESESKDD